MHGSRIDFLSISGVELISYMEVLHDSQRVMTDAQCASLLSHCMRHLLTFSHGGGQFLPKHHLFVHMTLRASTHGNPRFHSTFVDESLNSIVGNLAQHCQFSGRTNWERRIFECVVLQSVLVPRSRFWGAIHTRIGLSMKNLTVETGRQTN